MSHASGPAADVALSKLLSLIWLVRHLPPEFLSLPPTPGR
jgi:hypothetical protein